MASDVVVMANIAVSSVSTFWICSLYIFLASSLSFTCFYSY
jgi:hypothetical protein